MKQVEYMDSAGRILRVLLPDDADESEAPLGIPIGPPDLEPLGLGAEQELALNHELNARGILTLSDALTHIRRNDAAWLKALGVDGSQLKQLFAGEL